MVLEIVTPMTYKLGTLSSLPYQHLLVAAMFPLECTQQGHRQNAFVQIREQGKAVGPRFFMTLKSQLRNALAKLYFFGWSTLVYRWRWIWTGPLSTSLLRGVRLDSHQSPRKIVGACHKISKLDEDRGSTSVSSSLHVDQLAREM